MQKEGERWEGKIEFRKAGYMYTYFFMDNILTTNVKIHFRHV